ncbi:MAG: hypothetical protein IAE80_14500 [Anaerolinea sp.]|nr:hypothetical protein [Anaerolinea sp.]
MSSTLDLYSLKWSTLNFFDFVQVYRDLDIELEHVTDEYMHAAEADRRAYFQGAMTAIKSAQNKLLAKLAEVLEEYGQLDPLDYPDLDARIRRARPIMELLAQDLFN